MSGQSMNDDERDRLRAVETAIGDMRVKQTEMDSLLRSHMTTVDQIKRDTSEIVELIKGASVLGRLAKWATVVIGGYLAGKGLKWW